MMNENYKIRREKAEEINGSICDFMEGVLIVGSVAYNPEAVTAISDLDLIGIADFSKIDFEELYRRLNQKSEPFLIKYASKGEVNVFSIVWDAPNFEVGLHLWDRTAFKKIIELRGNNFVFRRENFSRNFQSTANKEILKNLRGIKKEVYKEPRRVDGGEILPFYTHVIEGSDFYLGIQVRNLLLEPIILSEKQQEISKGIEQFRKNLIERLRGIYGKSSKDANLYNASPQKIKEKISSQLRYCLESFF